MINPKGFHTWWRIKCLYQRLLWRFTLNTLNKVSIDSNTNPVDCISTSLERNSQVKHFTLSSLGAFRSPCYSFVHSAKFSIRDSREESVQSGTQTILKPLVLSTNQPKELVSVFWTRTQNLRHTFGLQTVTTMFSARHSWYTGSQMTQDTTQTLHITRLSCCFCIHVT